MKFFKVVGRRLQTEGINLLDLRAVLLGGFAW